MRIANLAPMPASWHARTVDRTVTGVYRPVLAGLRAVMTTVAPESGTPAMPPLSMRPHRIAAAMGTLTPAELKRLTRLVDNAKAEGR